MLSIAIIMGSTRPQRKADVVARWVHGLAARRAEAAFELIDLRDFNLPLLDEPLPPVAAAVLKQQYTQPHTRVWSAKVAQFDGYIFVTPEYNHDISAALKNAIDYLYPEWNNKAAGFVGYGSSGGARAIEKLRTIMAELQVATVRAEVNLNLFTDFERFTTFKPAPAHEQRVNEMIDQLIAWSGALKPLRSR